MYLKYILALVLSVSCCQAQVGKMVCFYDSASFQKEGPAQLSLLELEPALNFCNYLIYGYAGIDASTYTLTAVNHEALSVKQDHFRAIIALKRKYPQLRVLLSVGGDQDILEDEEAENNKYLKLLEDETNRSNFKLSVQTTLSTYGFDGIDLAWQFPKTRPKVAKSGLKKAWHTVKGWFGNNNIVDKHAEEHREQFTTLVRGLRHDVLNNGQLLTLTMLPHVSAELFIDVPAVLSQVDFVNLGTYDFFTPSRNPKTADLPAPLYAMYERSIEDNVDYQVSYWLNQTAPAHKLIVGVASYGRAWIMSDDSGLTGYPPVSDARGAAHGGKQTQTDGLLSWPEICEMLHGNKELTGEAATLHKVGDPTKRYGIYAYRAADENGEFGLWVGYEDPTTAAIKADYVRAKNLGGIALHDLSYDDFRGQCAGEKYPILRSIKYKL